jgi:cytosine/adenosine deaminase-related metal-dependent hydrolase
MEARQAMLLAKLRDGADIGTARMALECATRGGAACLGRIGELGEISVGSVGDVTVWSLEGPQYAGVVGDPIEGWLRCGPGQALHTIVNGEFVVRNGQLASPRLGEMLVLHDQHARRLQSTSS